LLKVAYGDDPPASIGPHVRKNLARTNPPFGNGLQCWRDLLGEWDSYIFSRVGEEDGLQKQNRLLWIHSPHLEGDPQVGREELALA
jgi:hypothetical protein